MTPATSGIAAGAGANAVRGIQNEQTMQHLSQTAEGVAGAEMKLGFLEQYECSGLKYELLSVTCRDAEVRRQRTLSAYRELYGDFSQTAMLLRPVVAPLPVLTIRMVPPR